MKLSFDFDKTLSRKVVQNYAKKLIKEGHEVYITTGRYDSIDKYKTKDVKEWKIKNLPKAHKMLFDIADKIGVPRKNIHFTNRDKKVNYIKKMGFLWHLDDDVKELLDIIYNSKTKGVICNRFNKWEERCNKIIEYEKIQNQIQTK